MAEFLDKWWEGLGHATHPWWSVWANGIWRLADPWIIQTKGSSSDIIKAEDYTVLLFTRWILSDTEAKWHWIQRTAVWGEQSVQHEKKIHGGKVLKPVRSLGPQAQYPTNAVDYPGEYSWTLIDCENISFYYFLRAGNRKLLIERVCNSTQPSLSHWGHSSEWDCFSLSGLPAHPGVHWARRPWALRNAQEENLHFLASQASLRVFGRCVWDYDTHHQRAQASHTHWPKRLLGDQWQCPATAELRNGQETQDPAPAWISPYYCNHFELDLS